MSTYYKKSNVLKRVAMVYATLIAITFSAIVLLPGPFFINIDMAQVSDAKLGEDVNFELCRQSRVGAVRAEGARTIRLEVQGDADPIKTSREYSFPHTIENNGCIPLSLTGGLTGENRQPQVPGEYFFTTNVFFEVQGVEKQTTYTSNVYKYGVE